MIQTTCRAKINLFLRVVGRTDDGFHLLRTLFQEISLADRLTWRPGGPPRLEVVGADVGPNEDNLVMRAAVAFAAATGLPVNGCFRLEKHIPAGGGLGGGSSDAAGCLRLLQAHHGAPLSASALADLALGLGSDVPFFLHGGTALGEGRGERLRPVPPPDGPQGGYLLLPGLGLPTGDVFRAYAAGARPDGDRGDVVGENHLTEAACAVSAPFARLWRELAARLAGECFFMTGSGSTCVWLTDADEAAVAGRTAGLGVRALPFRFVGRKAGEGPVGGA